MLIKHKFPHKKLILPTVGEIELNPEDNSVDVPEEVAELLLNGDDWSIVEIEDEEDTEGGEGEGSEGEDGEEGSKKSVEETNKKAEKTSTDDVDTELEKLSIKELKAFAKEAGLTVPNIFSQDVKKLRNWLGKKLK